MKTHAPIDVAALVTPKAITETLQNRFPVLASLEEQAEAALAIWDEVGPEPPFRLPDLGEDAAGQVWAALRELLSDAKDHAAELRETLERREAPLRRGRLLELHGSAVSAAILADFVNGDAAWDGPHDPLEPGFHKLWHSAATVEALAVLLFHRQGMEPPPLPPA